MIITISGLPGSGKSTVGKIISMRLGYMFYSMGDMRGKMATDLGMTIDELNELGKREQWTDRKVDEQAKKLGEEEDNFVMDGWISFHFIPHSFKVFLDVEPEEGARRVFRDQRKDERDVESVRDAGKMLESRVENTKERYKKYYNVDFLDRKHYDLVLDTTKLSPEEAAEKIIKASGNRKG